MAGDERRRLDSVDALRGLTVAAMLLVNNPGDWGHVYGPLRHAEWDGWTFTDLIFPFFLFIVGVSLSLGVGPRLELGADPARMRHAVLLRALRIVLLGLLLHAVAHWALDTRAFRPLGVLQRIGLCLAAAGMLATGTRPRTQWAVFASLLIGHALAMHWGGPLTKEGNLAGRIDTALLGRYAYEFDAATGRGHEPEGLLGTLPAIATTLLGVRAGDWLRRGRLGMMWGAAVGALAGGALAALVVPLNKQLWSASFVLWTGGWAVAGLAVAHVTIDRRGAPAIGRRFGINAIAAYAGSWLMACLLAALHWDRPIQQRLFEWMTPPFAPQLPSLAYALTFVGVWWIACVVLDRRRIHIKL
jgi:predicted acyltransferase